jgi:hypothetical protein
MSYTELLLHRIKELVLKKVSVQDSDEYSIIVFVKTKEYILSFNKKEDKFYLKDINWKEVDFCFEDVRNEEVLLSIIDQLSVVSSVAGIFNKNIPEWKKFDIVEDSFFEIKDDEEQKIGAIVCIKKEGGECAMLFIDLEDKYSELVCFYITPDSLRKAVSDVFFISNFVGEFLLHLEKSYEKYFSFNSVNDKNNNSIKE